MPTSTSTQLSFGAALKRLRRQRHLSQEALAERTSYSRNYISMLELHTRSATLPTAELLADALDLTSSERTLLLGLLKPTAPQPKASILPLPLTPFIGRETEVQHILAALQCPTTRLLTITGSAGVGKTSLSLAVAQQVQTHPQRHVVFIELAAITEPDALPIAIAQALGVAEQGPEALDQHLITHIAGTSSVWILDNFEQVVAGADLLAHFLRQCPQLTIIVTSRTRMHLRGEVEFALSPLALPDPNLPIDPATAPQYAAITLFLQRATAVRPDLVLDDAALATIVAICQRLDGVPLALELAAARTKMFSLTRLLAQLTAPVLPFALLTGGARDLPLRQQNLEAAIAWTYELLTRPEQQVLRLLAIFAGGCTLEQASVILVAQGGVEPLDSFGVLASLVDWSLLIPREVNGVMRYLMLQTIRDFSLTRLRDAHEISSAATAHAQFYGDFAEQATVHLIGPQQGQWLQDLAVEHENFRAVLHWTKRHDPAHGLRLVGALHRFWDMRGYLTEGRRWLRDMLAISPDPQSFWHRRALYAAADLAYRQQHYPEARQLGETLLTLNRSASDQAGEANALTLLGMIAAEKGAYTQALNLLTHCLTLRQQMSPWDTARALTGLGYVANLQGDIPKAAELFTESLPLFRAAQDANAIASTLNNLGVVAYEQGNLRHAQTLHTESLTIYAQLGGKRGQAMALNNLGLIATRQGAYDQAQPLLLQALALRRELGSRFGIARTLTNLGNVARDQGVYDQAEAYFQESLLLFEAIGDQKNRAYVLACQGRVARVQDPQRASALLEASLLLYHTLQHSWGLAFCRCAVGHLACDRGDYQVAGAHYRESYQLYQAKGTVSDLAEPLEGAACVASHETSGVSAVRLYGNAAAWRLRQGTPLAPVDRPAYERQLVHLRAALGDPVFDANWAIGLAMSPEAVRLMLCSCPH